MRFQIVCECGLSTWVQVTPDDYRTACPGCKRSHVITHESSESGGGVLAPVTRRAGGPSLSGLPMAVVGVSAALAVVLLITTAWAVLSPMPEPTVGAMVIPPMLTDDDPYAQRMRRGGGDSGAGPGAGMEMRGDGPGAGSEGEGRGGKDGPGSAAVIATSAGHRPAGASSAVEPLSDLSRELALAAPDNVPPPALASDKAGAYGARGRRRDANTGATPETEAAVEAGLTWLARNQSPDGHWGPNGSEPANPANTGSEFELGITSVATLAFLGAGYTHHESNRYQINVRRALKWILSRQQPDGSFRRRVFYEQGLATMVLCETYGMTGDEAYKEPAQRGLNCIINNMGPGGGYGYEGPGDDVHCTSFQIMAIKSGMLAKLQVDHEVIERFRAYMNRTLNPDGTTGYSSGPMPGTPESTRTAVGLFSRLFLGYGADHPDVTRIAGVVRAAGPQVGNVFQTYNATYAMYQLGGPGWTDWNQRFAPGVVALQHKAGPLKGSWDATGHTPGRVTQTALYVMALEVYYRFLPVNK